MKMVGRKIDDYKLFYERGKKTMGYEIRNSIFAELAICLMFVCIKMCNRTRCLNERYRITRKII